MTEDAQGDDGAALVQEVLKDNPAEDRGVREEWDAHVGWNRKEYIGVVVPPIRKGIRGAGAIGEAQREIKNVTFSTSTQSIISSTSDDKSLPWLLLPLCGLAMLMVYFVGRFLMKNSNKTRTS